MPPPTRAAAGGYPTAAPPDARGSGGAPAPELPDRAQQAGAPPPARSAPSFGVPAPRTPLGAAAAHPPVTGSARQAPRGGRRRRAEGAAASRAAGRKAGRGVPPGTTQRHARPRTLGNRVSRVATKVGVFHGRRARAAAPAAGGEPPPRTATRVSPRSSVLLHPKCHSTGPNWSKAQQGLLAPPILPRPFPWQWVHQDLGRDSGNLVNPFMHVTN